MQETKIIKVNNLYCIYNENQGSQTVSLTNINYEFDKNKIYCIIGNSGSGKTTLVTHFNGLIKPKYGEIETETLKFGLPYNLNDIQICCIDYININDDSFYFLFNQYRLSKKIASIIIESIYKTKVTYIKSIKNNFNNYVLFKIKFDKSYIIKINKKYTIEDANSLLTYKKIFKPSISQLWKNRKIKHFKTLRKNIGMVFQFPEYQLFKETIEKDIMFGPIALGIKQQEAKMRAKKYLNKLGLGDEYLNRSPFGLSGGQKRRVAIAGILAIETPVLIFDEPTAGLDPVGEQEMMDIILEAKTNNRTVFVITHTMDHVLEIADEVIVMHEGEIIKTGTPYEIFTNSDLLNKTSINMPKVIKMINDLISKDEKFTKLLQKEPKTIEQLAQCLQEFI